MLVGFSFLLAAAQRRRLLRVKPNYFISEVVLYDGRVYICCTYIHHFCQPTRRGRDAPPPLFKKAGVVPFPSFIEGTEWHTAHRGHHILSISSSSPLLLVQKTKTGNHHGGALPTTPVRGSRWRTCILRERPLFTEGEAPQVAAAGSH